MTFISRRTDWSKWNKTTNMKYISLFLSGLSFMCSVKLSAQPYIDLVNARYSNSPANSGLTGKDETPLTLQHAVAGLNIPIPLNKQQTDALLLLPYVEQWKVGLPYKTLTLQGLGVPVGLQKTLNKNWRITGILFYRLNTSTGLPDDIKNKHQWGTAIIGNYIKNEALTYKFGFYYNREFYGNFFMPLLGIDWQINARNAIFGTLPGAITWESKVTSKFYYGANFRAITNSYRYAIDGLPGYVSIDENQIGAYADYYLGKHLVINAELGHSVIRKIKSGLQDQKRSKATLESAQDNVYFRVMAAYRLRLR